MTISQQYNTDTMTLDTAWHQAKNTIHQASNTINIICCKQQKTSRNYQRFTLKGLSIIRTNCLT